MKNAYIWVLWLVNAIIFVLSTRNPIYLFLVLISLFILGNRKTKPQHRKAWFILNLRFLISMILISSLVNGLFTHLGQTKLFHFPSNWLLIGGDITLESLIYGAVNGLIIGSLYLSFNIFNLALSVKQLSRLIPRAFHPIGMTATLALTFFPSIQQRAREIKEAQMIRGNPMKKISDWLPILLPLIVTSLEDAIILSESMTSRGFHAVSNRNQENFSIISLVIGTFLIFSGWILNLFDYPQVISIFLYVVGGSLIIFILLKKGCEFRVTHYHRVSWQKKDIIFCAIFLIAIITQIIFAALYENNFSFTPYPQLSMPSLNIGGFLLSVVPLIPILASNHD
ncbi:MAG: energy-coupling factor transporter transmembrane component T [Brevefilum sp.]|nr:energy-coupling factor transporter transmembrane component T [Brevefilum sp.]MDT8380746.1 energy-coupling factor transporter transmembrane component T [Brevefilum sp.]MDW7754264.1 energy-coupling factor transporter transmembrane component T [Brevefilum sp.]